MFFRDLALTALGKDVADELLQLVLTGANLPSAELLELKVCFVKALVAAHDLKLKEVCTLSDQRPNTLSYDQELYKALRLLQIDWKLAIYSFIAHAKTQPYLEAVQTTHHFVLKLECVKTLGLLTYTHEQHLEFGKAIIHTALIMPSPKVLSL